MNRTLDMTQTLILSVIVSLLATYSIIFSQVDRETSREILRETDKQIFTETERLRIIQAGRQTDRQTGVQIER